MVITTKIINQNGEEEMTATSSSPIPDYKDFDNLGFRLAFDELEGSVLQASNEVNTKVLEYVLREGSIKSRMKQKTGQTPKEVK
jgi:hypothetical protein